MKDKYIIPIFISHKGCPNQCTFCNQKKISGSIGDIDIKKIKNEIEEGLRLLPKGMPLTEIAFFGGSFTGIEKIVQEQLLILANEYIKENKVR